MCSLKSFHLKVSTTIDRNTIEEILCQLPLIEELHLCGNLSYFNLDGFFNLRILGLWGTLNDDFNFEILKKLCIQLESLSIYFQSPDFKMRCDARILKLLNDLHFPNLQSFSIINCNVSKVTKKFIDQFPTLRALNIVKCNLEAIEDGAFSSLKQLVHLDLKLNLFVSLKNHYFSELINLENLYLSHNRLEFIEDKVFSNLKNLQEIDLSNNELSESVVDSKLFICLPNLLRIFIGGNNSNFDNYFE